MLIGARPGCVLLAILVFGAAHALQQTPAPSKTADGKIHLEVVVTPKTGAADIGLQQQDFTVLSDGVPQAITSFKAFTTREAPPGGCCCD